MLVPVGFYSFRNRVLAYRRDFCAACGTEGLALKTRGYTWLSLFAIPVLPLGYRDHWTCMACGRPPQASFRIPAAVLALAGFAVSVYATAVLFTGEPVDDDRYHLWEARLLFAAFAAFTGLLALKFLRIPDRRDRLRRLEPCSREACALCGGALDHGTPPRCPACDVTREELPSR